MHSKSLRSTLFWVAAMILCPLGVAFSSKSGFGVSMIEAPVYVLYNFIGITKGVSWYTFGTSEYLLQGVLLIALCLAIRRFKWRYLLSFGTAFIYGKILDLWYMLLGREQFTAMPVRVISAILGIVITAFAVSLFFRTSLPQEVWELFVKELSQRYAFNMTKVKWIYDCSSLSVGIILMIIFFGRVEWNMIGFGTIVTTLVNAPIIGLCGRIVDTVFKPFVLEGEVR